MDFNDNPDEAAFRAQARAWLDANVPRHLLNGLQAAVAQTTSSVHPPEIEGQDPVAISKAWQMRKAEGGWACLHWPTQYGGRGASPIERVIWQQEEVPYAQLSNLFVVNHGMAGPTIIAHGSEAQKQRYLKPMVSGETVWCQLFRNPPAARTWPACARAASATVTTGSSMARRSGPPAHRSPTTGSWWSAPTPRWPSTQA